MLAAALFLTAPVVRAHPEGAPWDNAGGYGREDCTSCYFDGAAVSPSTDLRLEGVGGSVRPGASYDLTVILTRLQSPSVGFLLRADVTGADGRPLPVGRFEAVDRDVETQGAAARSTKAGSRADGTAEQRWRVVWQAPETFPPGEEIAFSLAANAGNDDQSPFGDVVHLSRIWVRIDR